MTPNIIRPTISEERLKELGGYLSTQWERAVSGRAQQVDGDYSRWEKLYRGVPREKIRTVPWYKSSNFVVKLTRMFLDTFCARTLNVLFATKPLYALEGFPTEVRESMEIYFNLKAINQWEHYKMAGLGLAAGNKNGTAVFKTIWELDEDWDVSDGEERRVVTFEGPRQHLIPFEDFYIYPITCQDIDKAEILFHRVRYIEEEARRKILQSKWNISLEELLGALKAPNDLKREEAQQEAGVTDSKHMEFEVIECHHRYALEEGGRQYRLVTCYSPALNKVIDLYHCPYSPGVKLFHDYRPFPKDDIFYGESMCELLAQSQEEASQIHNDRRNQSFMLSAPVFKRRSGSGVPNPSTNWYPGKVFDVDSMDDFDVIQIGKNYQDMMAEENHILSLAERLSGIGPVMQGNASGMMGKRGIYNAQGTMAVLAESNQRQDTNIRDFREVMSRIARTCYMMQCTYGKEDKLLETFSPEMRAQILRGFQLVDQYKASDSVRFLVKASNASVNSEVRKAATIQMSQVLSQYANAVTQMSMQLANPQINPTIRLVMNDVVKMHRWMATRILRDFDEYEAEGVLPDVAAAIEASIPGGSRGTSEEDEDFGLPAVDTGGAQGSQGVAQGAGGNAFQALVGGLQPPGGGMAGGGY